MKTTGIRVQWIQIIFYNPNFQPCHFPELNVIFSLMNSITCSVFSQQNTSLCIDLSVQAASSIFYLLLLLVCGQMSLIIRVCCWPWVQKNFRSSFRKIFFHCPCANLFDFSSSLICLSESAFSQCSCSLLTLKVAPRSAAGPGPWHSTCPAPSWRQSALCLQYAQFPLDEAGKPLHRSELRCHGQRVWRCHDMAFLQWQGWRAAGLLQQLMLLLQRKGRAAQLNTEISLTLRARPLQRC